MPFFDRGWHLVFPEVLIDFFELLDQLSFNIEGNGAQSVFKGVQLLFDILQNSSLEMLGFDLEDGYSYQLAHLERKV